MLMGSDYPHLLGSIDRAVSTIEELDVSQADRAAIFSGNALRILNNVHE
jgi:predicted TIM-barrel fold metal-dependent hydrolase